MRIHIQHTQSRIGGGGTDFAAAFYFGVIAHAAQQAVGDARGAAAAAGDFHRAGVVDVQLQQSGGTADNHRQIVVIVKLQPRYDAETVAQRIGEHTGAGGGADQGKRRQIDFYRAGGGAFADHDVELIILQRGIQNFFHHRAESVNFVDKQNIVRLEIGEQSRQIAGALQHRAGSLAQVHTQFFGDDVRQRGFAQAGRAEQ